MTMKPAAYTIAALALCGIVIGAVMISQHVPFGFATLIGSIAAIHIPAIALAYARRGNEESAPPLTE